MRFTETGLAGVIVVSLERRLDERGFFSRSWGEEEFADAGVNAKWVQANVARSTRAGTIRGLHLQSPPFEELKLVRCTRGAIFDVAVDVREQSPSLGKWVGVELNQESGDALLIPEGYAHGYQTMIDETEITYMTTARYTPAAATGYRFSDPFFGIRWPLEATVVGTTDAAWPLMSERTP